MLVVEGVGAREVVEKRVVVDGRELVVHVGGVELWWEPIG